MNDKEKFFKDFNNSLHLIGRIMLIIMLILLVAVPFIIGGMNNVSPDVKGFFAGLAKVGIVYIPVSFIEFLVYTPMLGVGGSYISFVTGNLTNMKLPCVMNSKDIAGTKPGTPEDEIVSTLSVATSGIVTTLVIFAGVIFITPLRPVLNSEVLKPAFDNVVPALFGALGYKYFSKSLKITAVPLLLMTVLCIVMPSAIDSVSTLMIVCGALALAIGYVLYRTDKL